MKTTRSAFKNSILPKSVKGGEEIEVLVSPIGTFPHPDGEQLCTREAFDALVEKWRADGEPEILVDFDHASETGGPTEAAAWATALRSDEDGLHATFRMTDKGAEALSATRYRYLSPAWYVDEEGHPTELSTIALTNRPNLPVPRLLNRKAESPLSSVATQDAEAGESISSPAGAGEGNPPEEGNTTEPQKNDMDKLREMLGLAAEATDEEVLAAVDALRAERDQLRSEKEQMEAAAKEAALDAEAEEFVEEKKEFVADRDACKNAYKRDPEGTRALFNALAAPKPAAPVDGKPARVVDVNAAQKPADADLLANCKSGAERIAWAMRHANG